MSKPIAAVAALMLCLSCGVHEPDPDFDVATQQASLSGESYVYLPGMRQWDPATAKGSHAVTGKVSTLPFSHPKAPSRNGTYFIPEHASGDVLPILVLTHGFKDSGRRMVEMFLEDAKRRKVALVAPDSAGERWMVPEAGKFSSDSQHAQDALQWLRTHIGHPSRAQVATAGHSYGARMASSLATNFPVYRSGMMLHGRYVQEAVGKNKVPLWISGSPRDNQFSFPVSVSQCRDFPKLFPGWPRGGPSLHTYNCATCQHPPQWQELRDAMDWFMAIK